MERWKIIERRVLLAAGVIMLLGVAWLLLTATVERVVGAGGLALCAYWAFWQALYEDRVGSDAPVTRGELILYRVWVWGRRLLLGAVAAVFFLFAGKLAQVDVVAAILVACLGLLAVWVGWFGGGRVQSLLDDRRVHGERKRRYRGIR